MGDFGEIGSSMPNKGFRIETPIVKVCSRCKEMKLASEFHWRSNKEKRLLCSQCKECRNRNRTGYRQRNNNLKAWYGITEDDFLTMLVLQDSKCAICEEDFPPFDGRTHAYVDHDHATGAVRALLCQACNHGLGHMRDDPRRLRNAANYLEEHALMIPLPKNRV